jgi:hypothetical protein
VRFIGPDTPHTEAPAAPYRGGAHARGAPAAATGNEWIAPPLHRIGPSPKRSRMLTAAGLGVGGAAPAAESAIYDELRRRFRDAGPGRRDAELPWTPSFLPSY